MYVCVYAFMHECQTSGDERVSHCRFNLLFPINSDVKPPFRCASHLSFFSSEFLFIFFAHFLFTYHFVIIFLVFFRVYRQSNLLIFSSLKVFSFCTSSKNLCTETLLKYFFVVVFLKLLLLLVLAL